MIDKNDPAANHATHKRIARHENINLRRTERAPAASPSYATAA